jgi:MoaA/NifB/PqqE/SkfB family radical SAM enzyme
MCSRNIHGGKDNPNLIINDWSLEDYKQIVNLEVLKQVDHIYFCGNFGDPIINSNLLEMCQYTTETNPNLKLRIHTNGGARNISWWKNLAKVMPKNHAVIFGIDGLEDTHHLYRIGTRYETVIENARAFIDAGGIAEWVFIKFKHNEHQLMEAERRAKEFGFARFSMKNTNRFVNGEFFDVRDRNGNFLYNLEPPTDNVVKFIDRKVIDKLDDFVQNAVIQCKAEEEKEIYIDAHKNVYPCCFIASVPYYYVPEDSVISTVKNKIVDQHLTLTNDLGEINSLIRGIKNIIDSSVWQTVWKEYWERKKLITCARICGTSNEKIFTKPREQFVKRVDLNE